VHARYPIVVIMIDGPGEDVLADSGRFPGMEYLGVLLPGQAGEYAPGPGVRFEVFSFPPPARPKVHLGVFSPDGPLSFW
jgi:hypothetical protein